MNPPAALMRTEKLEKVLEKVAHRRQCERFHIENNKIERFISARWVIVSKPPLPLFEVRQETKAGAARRAV